MGGKTQTSTTNSTQNYTPAGLSNLQDIYAKAAQAASTPYQPYTGQLTAGLTDTQLNAVTGANNAANLAQPYYQQAGQLASGAAGPLTAAQIQQYQNPYTQSVIDATRANFAEDNGVQQQQVVGNAALKGALGGDRVGVAQAELARQQKLAQDPVIAGLQSQGYTQALQTAQQQFQQNPLAAAASLGNIGTGAQNAALQGVQGQLTAGGVQQQTNQTGLTNDYQQYLNALAFPYQQANFLAGIGIPASGAMGGTSTGDSTSTQPGPSIFSQILGLGSIGLGAYAKSDERVKEDIKHVGKLFDGQPVYSFKYKGSPMTQIGLMAQDVEKKKPEAVKQIDGVKGVDYHVATSDAADKGKFSIGGAVTTSPFDFIHNARGYVPAPISVSAGAAASQPSLASAPTGQSQQPANPLANISSLYNLGSDAGTAYNKFMGSGSPFSGASSTSDFMGLGGLYADGGGVPATFDERFDAAFPFSNPSRSDDDVPIVADPGLQQVSPQAMQDWRNGVDQPNPAVLADSDAPQTGNAPSIVPSAPPMSVALPPQITGPQDGSSLPTSLMALDSTGQSPFTASASPSTPEPSGNPIFGHRLSDNASTGLIAAGLGMLASRSPFAGVALGEGGLQGLAAYSAANKADQEAAAKKITQQQEQRRIDLEGQRIANQAQQSAISSSETARHNKATESATKYTGIGSIVTESGAIHPAVLEQSTGKVLDAVTGQPPKNTDKVQQKGETGRNDPAIAGHIADAIASGQQPPTLTGLYGQSGAVRANLEKKGFDLAKANIEWTRAKKQVAALNGPQMTRFVGLADSVNKTIDEVRELSKELDNSGIPALNSAKLALFMKTQGNTPKGQLAAKYIASINTLKEEFASLAQGGYAPTESVWHLANQQINGEYGVKQLGASLDEIQRLIRYRVNAIPGINTLGAGAANRYTGQQQTEALGGPNSPAPTGGSPGNAAAIPAPITKTIAGKTYVQRDGQWYTQ